MKMKYLIIAVSVPLSMNAQTYDTLSKTQSESEITRKVDKGKFEFVVAGGVSVNSKPTGIMYYKGESVAPNYSLNAKFLSNLNHNFQIGIDLNVSRLSRKSTQTYISPMGEATIGGNDKIFIYSKTTPALCFVLNKKVNMGSSSLYGGLALGVCAAINQDKTLSSNVSYIGPNGGVGSCMGAQLGYSYFFSKKVALNIEGSFRNINLVYDAHAPNYVPYSRLYYGMNVISGNIGLKYLINRKKSNHRGTPVTVIVLKERNNNTEKDTVWVNSSSIKTHPANYVSEQSNKNDNRKNKYAILVTVVGNYDSAMELKSKITSAIGRSASIIKVNIDYEIWLNDFSNSESAIAYLPKLEQMGYPQALVVKIKN